MIFSERFGRFAREQPNGISIRHALASWDFRPAGTWRQRPQRILMQGIRRRPIRSIGRAVGRILSILGYPVITLTESWTHQGSKTMLLGENADPALARRLSTDRRVTAETPPTFLFHTNADTAVPVENSVHYFLALRKAGCACRNAHLQGRAAWRRSGDAGPRVVGVAEGSGELAPGERLSKVERLSGRSTSRRSRTRRRKCIERSGQGENHRRPRRRPLD